LFKLIRKSIKLAFFVAKLSNTTVVY